MQGYQGSFFDLAAVDINGNLFPFSQLRGKVCLVVNTASKGSSKKKLRELQLIQDRYHGRPFSVIAFPCKQFFWQEKKNDNSIGQKYASLGLTFPVMSRSDVNGNHTNDVFRWLKSKEKGIIGHSIEDNFVKFIVDGDGVTVHRYPAHASMSDICSHIDESLMKLEHPIGSYPNLSPITSAQYQQQVYPQQVPVTTYSNYSSSPSGTYMNTPNGSFISKPGEVIERVSYVNQPSPMQ